MLPTSKNTIPCHRTVDTPWSRVFRSGSESAAIANTEDAKRWGCQPRSELHLQSSVWDFWGRTKHKTLGNLYRIRYAALEVTPNLTSSRRRRFFFPSDAAAAAAAVAHQQEGKTIYGKKKASTLEPAEPDAWFSLPTRREGAASMAKDSP